MSSVSELPANLRLDMADEEPAYVPPSVNWNAFAGSQLITAKEFDLVDRLERLPTFRARTLEDNAPEYAALLSKLANFSKADSQQYIFKLIDEALSCSSKFASVYYNSNPGECLQPFLRALAKTDAYLVDKALSIISSLLQVSTNISFHTPDIQTAIDRAVDLVRSSDSKVVEAAVAGLSQLLRNQTARDSFAASGNFSALTPLLRPTTKVQVMYYALLCFWCVSYAPASFPRFKDARLVALLHDVLRSVSKEKNVRIALYTLKNIITDSSLKSEMLAVGVPRTINNMTRKSYGDDDITEEVKNLDKVLENEIFELSSFDDYRQEVMAGRLEQSPAHTSDKFWKENVMKFEANDNEILRELVKLLSSGDAQTVTIALADIGEFVRFHPRGKKVVAEIGAKTTIMSLLENSNEAIRRAALLATQRLLVSNFEFASRTMA